jgi:membrane protein
MRRKPWAMMTAIFASLIADRAMTRGAAITRSMLLVIAIAGLVFGREAVRGALLDELGGLMGS